MDNSLINSLILSNYIVIYVLLTTLSGILVIEYFHRTNQKRKEIPFFISILGLTIILVVIDTYRHLSGKMGFIKLITGLSIFLFILFGTVLYRFWNKLNKKLFGVIFLLSVFALILFLFTHISKYIMLFHIALVNVTIILFYFFIIDFLISNYKTKNRIKMINKNLSGNLKK